MEIEDERKEQLLRRLGIDNNAFLDQIHIPDPVSQELCRLQAQLARLEKKLEQNDENN